MPDDLEERKLQLEQVRFDHDKEVDIRRLVLDEKIAIQAEEDANFKKQERRWTRFTNPATIALFTAAAGLFTNALVAYLTMTSQLKLSDKSATLQRELLDRTSQEQGNIEITRAENTSIVEVIKLTDVQKVHDGVCRLLGWSMIQTKEKVDGLQAFADLTGGCNVKASVGSTTPSGPTAPPLSRWAIATRVVPGCGDSGCYARFEVCGDIPPATHVTNETRNFADSFGLAWGQWAGDTGLKHGQMCSTFIQHSHNQSRIVSFEFEVQPNA